MGPIKNRKRRDLNALFVQQSPKPLLGTSQGALGNVSVGQLWENPNLLKTSMFAFPWAVLYPCLVPAGGTELKTKSAWGRLGGFGKKWPPG